MPKSTYGSEPVGERELSLQEHVSQENQGLVQSGPGPHTGPQSQSNGNREILPPGTGSEPIPRILPEPEGSGSDSRMVVSAPGMPVLIQPSADPFPSGNYRYHPSNRDPPYYHDYTPDTGAIQIISSPYGARVYLNNEYQGKTPSSGYLDVMDLTQGTYSLILTYPGYEQYSTIVTVNKNEVTSVNAVMTLKNEVVTSTDSGIVTVWCDPVGSNVFLDNVYKGITPLTLQKVSTGDHIILVRNEGYSEYRELVSVIPDQTLALSVMLTPVFPKTTLTKSSVPVLSTTPVPVATQAGFSPFIVCIGLIAGVACLAWKKSAESE